MRESSGILGSNTALASNTWCWYPATKKTPMWGNTKGCISVPNVLAGIVTTRGMYSPSHPELGMPNKSTRIREIDAIWLSTFNMNQSRLRFIESPFPVLLTSKAIAAT
eukprot:CAMPEP_0198601516 /NCGR_PEP_ID=MMETSP1462-20131121/149615_1 /TAXON_ID=1333877 /ORGANISM="Brandtodinium nutriculum, Strain RCC3387" /LENGTH=107 /DNA_ID=CAMNT_0044333249 /DNA_START=309 /DNA_END=632 /DNA_ORIENTATION=+